MKKRINSRQKGARIEREAAKFLTSLGYLTTRAARNGVDGAADLVLPPTLSGVHVEVKGDESIDIGTDALYKALCQSSEAGVGTQSTCVLWHRKHRGWRLSWFDNDMHCLTVAHPSEIKAYLHKLNQLGS